MIAETLAGIALVKSAVDGIKSAIGTANDIGEIASHIDVVTPSLTLARTFFPPTRQLPFGPARV